MPICDTLAGVPSIATVPLLLLVAKVRMGLAANVAVRVIVSVTVKVVSTAALLFLMFTLLPAVHFCM